jgi:ABC-type Fe3+-siderophore transport system permease subunit
MIIRLLVTEEIMGKTRLPRKLMAFVIGLKYTTSVAILLGVSVTTSASPVYVGALSHIAVFLLLIVGLL